MDKKEYVLALLNKLSDQALPVRQDIISLIEGGILWDDFLDVLISIFEDAQKTLNNTVYSDQIQKSLEFLRKLKASEELDRQHDVDDLLDLDQMLKDI